MGKGLRTELRLRGKLAGARERLSKRLGEELTHYDIYAAGVESLSDAMTAEEQGQKFLDSWAKKHCYDAKVKK